MTTADVTTVPELVGGRFQIRGLLATGGEAEVHLARDLELDLDVVVKTRRVVDDEDLGRLRREAGMLMRIVAHGGLPTVRSDLVEAGRYYMISDHVVGNDLRVIVDAQDAAGLPLPTVLGLVDQLAETLDHLHGHQPAVVHGDVKPENVIVTADGRAVLVDFGAAMRVGDDRERLGTPGFSAPEVLAGEALSPAADVYSLAALTVYLLTGIVPKLGTAWPEALGDLVRLERVLRRGLPGIRSADRGRPRSSHAGSVRPPRWTSRSARSPSPSCRHRTPRRSRGRSESSNGQVDVMLRPCRCHRRVALWRSHGRRRRHCGPRPHGPGRLASGTPRR